MKKKTNIVTMKSIIAMAVMITMLDIATHAQQGIQFTQYMFNGLVINPAYAGADEALSLTFIHRDQWRGVDQAPQTQTLSAHTLFNRDHTGIGLTVVNDRIGVHRNLDAALNYAYHIKVGRSAHLSMGLKAGFYSRRSDYQSLSGSAPYDPKVANAMVSHHYFDVGAGVYYRSPRLHFGFSIPELLPEKLGLNDTLSITMSKSNMMGFAKYTIALNDDVDLEPSVLIKYLSKVPLSFDLNINMVLKKILTLGISYRKSESVDFLMKCKLTTQLQFGYSYDHTIANASKVGNASHEMMVQYLFRYVHHNVSSPR